MDSNLTLAYILIFAGILLLAAELFLFSGLILVLAMAAIAVGVTMTFAHDTTTGVVTLLAVVVTLPILSSVILHISPRTRWGRRFFLPRPEEDDTLAARTSNQQLERLRGRYARTISDLRPAGVADFDGRRVDVITEGMMVDAGQWVRCIDVQAGKVVVRPTERPGLGDLETAIFS